MRMMILPGVAAVSDWRLVFFNYLFYRESVCVCVFKIKEIFLNASPFLISSRKVQMIPSLILGYLGISEHQG